LRSGVLVGVWCFVGCLLEWAWFPIPQAQCSTPRTGKGRVTRASWEMINPGVGAEVGASAVALSGWPERSARVRRAAP